MGFDLESLFQFAGRLEYLGIVGESRRPYEHVSEFLEDTFMRVVLHFEEGWTNARFGLLALDLLGLRVLHRHLHSNNDNQCSKMSGYCYRHSRKRLSPGFASK